MMSKCSSGDAIPTDSVHRQQEIVINELTEKEGLDKAYAKAGKLHINGNNMCVAGTSYLQDARDDFEKPLIKTAWAQRYVDADALLSKNPEV